MASQTALSESLPAALEQLARKAGTLAMRFYGKVRAREKPDRSIVTEADLAVEDLLRAELPRLLPEAAYIGEETTRDRRQIEVARAAEWLWIVDPIDGTAAFNNGLDNFGVSIGLFRHGRPYAGTVYFPALGHSYRAVRGGGSWYDGQPIHVLTHPPIPDCSVLYVDARAHLKYRIAFPGKTRSLGSTAYHYLLTARGAAVGALSTAHVWDYAGAAAVLLEAGGVLRHLDGSDIDWTRWLDGESMTPPVLGAPPLFSDELRRQITVLDSGILAV